MCVCVCVCIHSHCTGVCLSRGESSVPARMRACARACSIVCAGACAFVYRATAATTHWNA